LTERRPIHDAEREQGEREDADEGWLSRHAAK
jgi:hypothetical protein